MIAPNVQIYTAYHPLLPEQRFIEKKEGSDCYYTTCADPVEIKDGAWIGGGVIILPGVTIGGKQYNRGRQCGYTFNSR